MKTSSAIPLFAIASLLPGACLLAASVLGGAAVWLALASITVLVLVMDAAGLDMEAGAGTTGWLPWAVGVMHFAALTATLWAIGGNAALDPGQKLVLGISMGLYAGQISNACAHELIHRPQRAARAFGTAMYCSILNGQHVSAHLLVHHVHAGTAKDPTTAPLGRGFYRFALQAGIAEFRTGWQAESNRLRQSGRGLHPYVIYLSGAAGALLAASLLGGGWGVLALLLISLHAQMQLLLSDYVQHYGLKRQLKANGKPEPMGPQHSWNAPHAYSAAMMMNAPRHSDHHMNPGRSFHELDLDTVTMPTLPNSLPVMGAIALAPPLWRRMMDPRARDWAEKARPARAPLPEPLVQV